jgi:predicted DNA-binding transcriptional regulator AlpA
MLTPDDVRKMTPEDRTALFEKLCLAWYSERLTRNAVAADFDVTRETVYRWIKDNAVPWPVLFTLERWVNSDARAEQIIASWGSIPAQLAEAAGNMSRIAGTLNRIAKLQSGHAGSGDTEAASSPHPDATEQ